LFSENFHIIHLVLYFLLIMAAACGGTFCDELRKCASRPAWGSHFGSRCSVGELLLFERLDTTCKHVFPALRGDHDFDFNVQFG
jgi:hypothetical protein